MVRRLFTALLAFGFVFSLGVVSAEAAPRPNKGTAYRDAIESKVNTKLRFKN